MSEEQKSLYDIEDKLKKQKKNSKDEEMPKSHSDIDNIVKKIEELKLCFEEKIMEDAYKNDLFDKMHKELTDCRNEVYEKIANVMALDIIQLTDAVKSDCNFYSGKQADEENYKKLLNSVEGIAQELEDILYRQNIEPYHVEGEDVDARKQKIIQTIPTEDKEKDNKVAQRTACGYEKNGKVLRQERIKIYKYKEKSD